MPQVVNHGVRISRTPWLVFAFVAAALYGNLYVYDSIGPIADLLQRQRGFSDTQIGMLNAIYSLPNIVLPLIGGVVLDRFGVARTMLWTAAVCLAGAALTALSPGFQGMATGRLLFGIGAETLDIGVVAAIAQHFAGKNMAFALGLCVAIGRAGSFSADMSPVWFANGYAQGWRPPLVIAIMVAAGSLAAAIGYWWIDHKMRGQVRAGATGTPQRFVPREMLRFGTAYWFLLALAVLWYAVIVAFRSTFSIKYFQHAHGLDLGTAGAMNSYVFLAALFTTPAFGWLCGKTGRYAPLLAFGALLLPLSIAIMTWTHWSLWVATALIGVSYSLVPAVLWPLTNKLVAPARFGTALGLIAVSQNAGIAGANLIAGELNDSAGAGALNPAGYNAMMLFFGVTSALGFCFALLLWISAGRRHHEAPVNRQLTGNGAS
jgi:MFS family permease